MLGSPGESDATTRPSFSRTGICRALCVPPLRSSSLTAMGHSNLPRQKLPFSSRYFLTAGLRLFWLGTGGTLAWATATVSRVAKVGNTRFVNTRVVVALRVIIVGSSGLVVRLCGRVVIRQNVQERDQVVDFLGAQRGRA